MKPNQAFIFGIVASYGYFKLSEANLPKDTNCSFLAPVSTDVLAVVAGGIVAAKGAQLNEPWLSFVGAAVLGIHTFQYLHFKTNG